MKVKLRSVIQDPNAQNGRGVEGFYTSQKEHFLDGPVSRRVAVVDFDADGTVVPGAPFRPPGGGRKTGQYVVVDETDLTARDMIQVSVFSTVLKTIYMFEEPDALGRQVFWAFNAPQLLIVPLAGEGANAFYERDSHSIQFFHFPSGIDPGQTVFTGLSADIVAHETGHAILDGIAPDLLNALTPQSLALHESVADLVAVLMAFRCRALRLDVLEKTNGSIDNANSFSWLAEQFAQARSPDSRRRYLRALKNDKTLDMFDNTTDENGEPNQVDPKKPHDLSLVLTGSLYAVMIMLFDRRKAEFAEAEGKSEYSMSGKALWVAAGQFKRMLLRALDYLPPGDVTFADFGRALMAADRASHPNDREGRDLFAAELVRRCVIDRPEILTLEQPVADDALSGVDLDQLVKSDWAAYAFADTHRALLGIPSGANFQVRQRLDVIKHSYTSDGPQSVRECLFKVSWEVREDNRLRKLGLTFPQGRSLTVGTTLVIDWYTKQVRALLVSDGAANGKANAKQAEQRSDMLEELVARGLVPVGPAQAADLISVARAGDVMRVRRTANLLHLVDGEAADTRATSPPGATVPPRGVDTSAFFNLVSRRR
jgi:hypothetical protein